MDCLIDGVYELPCRDSSGGVVVVRLSDWRDRVFSFSGNIIEGTDAGDGSAQVFHTIEQMVESAEADEDVKTGDSGASYYEQKIVITLPNKGDKLKDDQIRNLKADLIKGKFLGLVKDQNGIEKLYGIENGLRLTTNEDGTGKTMTDLNGATTTLIAKEPKLARIVNLPGGGGGATPFVIKKPNL